MAPPQVGARKEASRASDRPVPGHPISLEIDERESNQNNGSPEEVQRGGRRASGAGVESPPNETKVAFEMFELIHRKTSHKL
jgi:hypothetical protein